MITVLLEIEHCGSWWTLNRRQCLPSDFDKERAELMHLATLWQCSGCFARGEQMRVRVV